MDFKTENKKITARLQELQGKYDLMSATKFATHIGVSPRTINYQLEEDGSLSLEVIVRILAAFPDIDANWLLKGEGSMFTSDNATKIVQDNSSAEMVETLRTTLNVYNKYFKDVLK